MKTPFIMTVIKQSHQFILGAFSKHLDHTRSFEPWLTYDFPIHFDFNNSVSRYLMYLFDCVAYYVLNFIIHRIHRIQILLFYYSLNITFSSLKMVVCRKGGNINTIKFLEYCMLGFL